jgi:glutaminyl-tRNA synthetase
VIYIEREDFMEDPPKKFFRLAPGREVRLRYAFFITCTGVTKDPKTGEITELRATYDPATRGGDAPDGRKVQGTLHWVSEAHSVGAEVRLFDRLFLNENPDGAKDGKDFKEHLNPASLEVLTGARAERSLGGSPVGARFQFERQGYFCVDRDSKPGSLVFNRTVSLKDTWAKMGKGS